MVSFIVQTEFVYAFKIQLYFVTFLFKIVLWYKLFIIYL